MTDPSALLHLLHLLPRPWPALAVVHEETEGSAGFLSGLQHPVTGIDHVLAMVAVGIWGAQLGRPAIWVLPVAFPIVMAVGGMLGLMGVDLPGTEIGIAASAIVLGTLVSLEARPPLWVAAAVVGFFAIFHGHAHGTELPAGSSGASYTIGFVVATGLLHAAGITIGSIHRWRSGKLVLRLTGALVASAGAYFLWRAVVPDA